MTSPFAALATAAVLVLSACTETRYSAYREVPPKEEEAAEAEWVQRNVEFEVTGDFYRDVPECAVVMPFLVDGRPHARADVVEGAMAAHMAERLGRLVGPREREQEARARGLDLAAAGNAATFARVSRCGYLLTAEPWGGDSVYAVFWTQSRLGLELKLTRAGDGALLWRARHVATRSEGGLPLSPLSALWNIAAAMHFKADADVDDSLAHDAVRRMARTLPDTRPALAADDGRRRGLR